MLDWVTQLSHVKAFIGTLGNFYKEFVSNYLTPGSVAAGFRGFYSGSKIWGNFCGISTGPLGQSLHLGILLFFEWQLALWGFFKRALGSGGFANPKVSIIKST